MEWIKLIFFCMLFRSVKSRMEPANHPDEYEYKISKECEGQTCTIPFPRFCKEPKVQCVYSISPETGITCVPVLSLVCACPPPTKVLYGGSLDCLYGTKHLATVSASQYAVLNDGNLGTALDPRDTMAAYMWSKANTSGVTCDCPILYEWCEWEPWSSWTNVCTFNATRYRQRSRACCESKNPANFHMTHFCTSLRDGSPVTERTQVEKAHTSECPLRTMFLDAKEAQRVTWSEYLLLTVSILLLLLIIVTVTLILRKINL